MLVVVNVQIGIVDENQIGVERLAWVGPVARPVVAGVVVEEVNLSLGHDYQREASELSQSVELPETVGIGCD